MSDRRETSTGAREYHHAIIENVFIVVWNHVSTAATSTITTQVQAAHDVYGDLVYVARIPDGTPAPDDDGRNALSVATKALLPYCSSLHCVIEGQGFRKSIIRGAATSIFLLSGQRGKMKVHDTMRDALESAPALDAAKVDRILRRAHDQGLIVG